VSSGPRYCVSATMKFTYGFMKGIRQVASASWQGSPCLLRPPPPVRLLSLGASWWGIFGVKYKFSHPKKAIQLIRILFIQYLFLGPRMVLFNKGYIPGGCSNNKDICHISLGFRIRSLTSQTWCQLGYAPVVKQSPVTKNFSSWNLLDSSLDVPIRYLSKFHLIPP